MSCLCFCVPHNVFSWISKLLDMNMNPPCLNSRSVKSYFLNMCYRMLHLLTCLNMLNDNMSVISRWVTIHPPVLTGLTRMTGYWSARCALNWLTSTGLWSARTCICSGPRALSMSSMNRWEISPTCFFIISQRHSLTNLSSLLTLTNNFLWFHLTDAIGTKHDSNLSFTVA